MRDVEQRLGKPDPSEDTQAKQKQIIKRIDTLIEQVRQSGSSAGKLTIRRRQQPGNQPGQQEGDQPGAQARGAGPMKPAKPTSQHSTAGGKGIWGHLPEELRQVMDNSFKEEMLGSKAEMISRYFLPSQKESRSGRSEAMDFFRWRLADRPGSRAALGRSLAIRELIGICVALLVIVCGPARGQQPGAGQEKSVEGFGESRRGDIPEGTDRDDDANGPTRRSQNGLAWLARTQNSDGSFGMRDVSRQHRGDQPLRAGVHGVGLEPGPRSVWCADRQGARVRDGRTRRSRVSSRWPRRRRTDRCIRTGSGRCFWRKRTG